MCHSSDGIEFDNSWVLQFFPCLNQLVYNLSIVIVRGYSPPSNTEVNTLILSILYSLH